MTFSARSDKNECFDISSLGVTQNCTFADHNALLHRY